jgi:hypothetical protein
MDARTGLPVDLDELERRLAEQQWQAYQAGLIEQKPRYVPLDGDKTPVNTQPKRKRRRGKARRSYKDHCR